MKKYILSLILIVLSIRLIAQNSPPVAVNDNASITNCDTFTIYPLINDYDPEGDSIWIMNLLPGSSHLKWGSKTNSTISILIYPDYYGIDSIRYRIASRDSAGNTQYAFGWIYLDIQNCHCVDSVNINNINARINNNGNLFWDFIDKPHFEVPKGSGKNSIFNNTLWIAGLDSVDTLHISAERYEYQGECDYRPGPVSSIYDSAYDAKWNHIWKIYKSDIDYHLAHCWQPGYVPAQVLLDWPANGDTTLGQQKITAPFYDWNHDEIYNPYAGDYPLIKGDEAVYFIYNDDRFPHTESSGNKLGVEIHGMAYAFDCPDDSALWNTIFIHYEIYNQSQYNYHNSYIGLFTDFDIGDALDDYVGCDVKRGSCYGYNGDNYDGTGNPQEYGLFPPIQSLTIIAGPYMDSDGIDNEIFQCDESINGMNFGNLIIDDERIGLTNHISTWSCPSGIPTDNEVGPSYYYGMLRSVNSIGPMQYGGMGLINCNAYGPDCKFQYPGVSDTCLWGTGGVLPNGNIEWTEISAGNDPFDRRSVCSMGPFTFEAGSIEKLDIAFVFSRNYTDTNATAAIPVMQQRIDSIRKYFVNDSTPCGLSFSGIVPSPIVIPQIKIFPNPAIGYITVEATGMLCDLNYELFDIIGRKIAQGTLKCTASNQINISGLDKGIYILNVSDEKKKFSRKFIKQ